MVTNPEQKEVFGTRADNNVGLREAHAPAEDYQRRAACVNPSLLSKTYNSQPNQPQRLDSGPNGKQILRPLF